MVYLGLILLVTGMSTFDSDIRVLSTLMLVAGLAVLFAKRKEYE